MKYYFLWNFNLIIKILFIYNCFFSNKIYVLKSIFIIKNMILQINYSKFKIKYINLLSYTSEFNIVFILGFFSLF